MSSTINQNNVWQKASSLVSALLLLALSGYPTSLKSQIYISEYFDGDLFVGPDNVMFVNDKIKSFYVDDLTYVIADLERQLSLIDSLESIPKLNRQEKKKLRGLKRDRTLVEEEVASLKLLLALWEQVEILDIDLEKDYCLFDMEEQTTRKVKVSRREVTTYGIYEFVQPGAGAPSTKWMKRKADKDCLSPNPEDCLVWCLIECTIPSITDFAGNQVLIQEEDSTYFDFKFDSTKSMLYRFIEIDFNQPEAIYSFHIGGNSSPIPYSRIELCDY